MLSSFVLRASSARLPLIAAAGLLAAAGLVGCAGKGSAPADTEATPAPAAAPVRAATPDLAPATAAAPDVSSVNPVVLPFNKDAVTLSPDAAATVGRVGERAKAARRIVITGYCDRTQIGNAREAAVARAMAVRNELAKAGVPAARMRIKFVTGQADRHAAEIEFEDAPGSRTR